MTRGVTAPYVLVPRGDHHGAPRLRFEQSIHGPFHNALTVVAAPVLTQAHVDDTRQAQVASLLEDVADGIRYMHRVGEAPVAVARIRLHEDDGGPRRRSHKAARRKTRVAGPAISDRDTGDMGAVGLRAQVLDSRIIRIWLVVSDNGERIGSRDGPVNILSGVFDAVGEICRRTLARPRDQTLIPEERHPTTAGGITKIIQGEIETEVDNADDHAGPVPGRHATAGLHLVGPHLDQRSIECRSQEIASGDQLDRARRGEIVQLRQRY